MHRKAHTIDGEISRTGSANFSATGERQQDNDLVVIRDAGAAAKFDAHFERNAPAEHGPPMSADRVRWEHIQRIYEANERNVSETARQLHMHRRTSSAHSR